MMLVFDYVFPLSNNRISAVSACIGSLEHVAHR